MAVQINEAERSRQPQWRSRRIPDDEYDVHRAKILDLYLKQKRSREDIIKTLAEEDRFIISLKQLKHRLQKWEARKNTKQPEASPISTRPRPSKSTAAAGQRESRICKLNHAAGGSLPKRRDGQRNALCSEAQPSTSPLPTDPRHRPASEQAEQAEPTSGAGEATVATSSHLDCHDAAISPMLNRSHNGLHFDSDHASCSPSDSRRSPILPFQTSPRQPYPAFGGLAQNSDSDPFEPASLLARYAPVSRHTTFDSVNECLPEDIAHHQTSSHPSTAVTRLYYPVSSQLETDLPGQRSRCQTWQAPYLDTSCHTDLDGFSPRLTQEDPTIIAPLLLNLRSLYSRFLDNGNRWYTSNLSVPYNPSLSEVCTTLKSPWVRAALESILCYYLQSSINWITSTQPFPPALAAESAPLETQQTTLNLPSLAHQNATTLALDESSSLFPNGHLVTWNLSAKENEHADMIRFQFRKWSRGRQDDPGLSMTLTYVPHACGSRLGVSLTLYRPYRILQQAPLRPSLRTFNVVSDHAPIIRCIRLGDSKGVQALLDLRHATPSDVDTEGHSLLSNAARYGRLEIFRLLLRLGASCEDVHEAFDVVAIIWGHYMLRDLSKDLMKETQQCLAMTEMAITKPSDIEPSQQRVLAGLSVLNKVKKVDIAVAQPVIEYIVSLFQLEWKGPSRRTPLLCACMTNSSMTLWHLISKGANIHAQDYLGRGGLHSALYARSYMICPDACQLSQPEIAHQCACPAEDQPHESHYIRSWTDCPRNNPSGLEETLRLLLRNGCNPNTTDNFGKTPGDYAAEHPDLMAIWQNALKESGFFWDPTSAEWLLPWQGYQAMEAPWPTGPEYANNLPGWVHGPYMADDEVFCDLDEDSTR